MFPRWVIQSGWRRSHLFTAAGASVLLLLVAATCYGLLGNRPTPPATIEGQLRVAVCSQQAVADHQKKTLRLLAYLERDFGIKCELVEVASHGELLDKLVANEIDLALLNAYEFVRAQQQCDVVPLVTRDVDPLTTAVLVAHGNTSNHSPQAYRGARLGIETADSTAGGVISRYLTEQIGEPIEGFFRDVQTYQTTVEMLDSLAEGSIDLAFVSSSSVRECIAARSLARTLANDTITVVWESPPYADHLWSIRAEMPQPIQQRLRDAFLSLRITDAEQALILHDQGATGYLPATPRDFQAVQDIFHVSHGFNSSKEPRP